MWLISLLAMMAWSLNVASAEAQLGALISPGPLARAHANLEGIANCTKCHEQKRRVTAQKCLACHAPVRERIARKSGVHRDVTSDCVTCHAEHAGVNAELRPFDTATFDHGAIGFPLTGKHALGSGKCAACHTGRSFLSVSAACVSCHTDVHKGSLGTSCASCHSTDAPFKGSATRFDHSKAAFQLTGAHQAVACADCHAGGAYKGVRFASCADCHKDPHRPALGSTCTSCHTTASWRTRSVNHDRTSFPLAGRHANVECAACHRQPAMRAALNGSTCAACHEDVHRGSFQQDCRGCHDEKGWKGATVDHAATRFPLTGRHAVECVKCHTNVAAPGGAGRPSALVSSRSTTPASRTVDFRGLKTACASCHDDVHGSELGAACETCHDSTTFAKHDFTHARNDQFFAGEHAGVTCDRCHRLQAPAQPARTGGRLLAVRFTSAQRACASCHTDVHLGQLGTGCETCHAVATPKFGVDIDHAAKTAFALTGRHADVACRECHKAETTSFPSGTGTAVRWKGVGTECRSCHADVHLGQLARTCDTCHTSTSFKVAAFAHTAKAVSTLMTGAHAKAACADCHKPSTGRFPAGTGTATRFLTGTACVSCHDDVHRGALGPSCGNCHRP